MTSRERVIKTLKQEEVDRLPRDLWTLPGIEMFRKDELEELLTKYPEDFETPECSYGKGKKLRGTCARVGQYTDAWGCVWHVAEPGVLGRD